MCKKFCAAICCLLLLPAMLTGCGAKPITREEFMERAQAYADEEQYDLSVGAYPAIYIYDPAREEYILMIDNCFVDGQLLWISLSDIFCNMDHLEDVFHMLGLKYNEKAQRACMEEDGSMEVSHWLIDYQGDSVFFLYLPLHGQLEKEQ